MESRTSLQFARVLALARLANLVAGTQAFAQTDLLLTGMTVEQLSTEVRAWLATAKHHGSSAPMAWIRPMAIFAKRPDLQGNPRIALLAGKLSPVVKQQFAAAGWTVQEGF